MRSLGLVVTCAAWLLSLGPAPAAAQSFAELDGGLRGTWDGVRAALHYLRTGNPMLAEVELDAAKASFAKIPQAAPPDPYAAAPGLATAMATLDQALAAGGTALAAGYPDAARQALAPIGATLAGLRREAGVWWLADCVAEMNLAIAGLRPFDRPEVALDDPATADAAKAAAAIAEHAWRRCRELAPAAVREEGEFRRLVDGALASLPLIRGTVDARDPDRLHAILIELWSFDHLLWLRYG